MLEVPAVELSRRAKSWLALAAKIAEDSDVTKRHGAVIVRGGSVLAVGTNRWRNRQSLNGTACTGAITTCAERVALSRAGNAEGATVYVARLDRGGKSAYSRPCAQCRRALRAANVRVAIFTISE